MVRPIHSTFQDDDIMKKNSLFAAVAFSLVCAGAVQAQPVMRDGVLADAAGRTLYIFDKDGVGKSNCNDACLVKWPAFVAKPGAAAKGEFGLIEANGARQWTVNGKPLYYFVGDAKAGDRNGNGMGGVWHVISEKPVSSTPKSAY
jgi:predicted lipoprotein with Yx(FWY)xxD motif